jgi:hypothetical protein
MTRTAAGSTAVVGRIMARVYSKRDPVSSIGTLEREDFLECEEGDGMEVQLFEDGVP